MSEHLNSAERAEALAQLANLETAIEELDDLGVDVARLGLRGTAAHIRAELGRPGRQEAVETWLRSMPEGQVISYRVQYPGNPAAVYSFAAVKHGTLWYTTARQGQRQFGSNALATWMVTSVNLVGCVRLRVERTSDTYRSPDIEMRQR